MSRIAMSLLVLMSLPFTCSAKSFKAKNVYLKKRPLTVAQKKRSIRIRKIVKSPVVANKRRLLLRQKSTAPKVYRLRKLLMKPKANPVVVRRTYEDLIKGLSRKEIILVTEALILDLRLSTHSRFHRKMRIPKVNVADSSRNKRQEYQTMFENFDQKANQLFNLLSTVLKSHREMGTSTARNLL